MNLEGLLGVIREYLRKPLVTAVLGFVVGLIIGLPVLGWGLFPVKWKDASPVHLRQDVKEEFVRMMVEAYAYDDNSYLALSRWKELGDSGNGVVVRRRRSGNRPGYLSLFLLNDREADRCRAFRGE